MNIVLFEGGGGWFKISTNKISTILMKEQEN